MMIYYHEMLMGSFYIYNQVLFNKTEKSYIAIQLQVLFNKTEKLILLYSSSLQTY